MVAGNNLVFDRIKFLAIPKALIKKNIKRISDNRFRIRLRSKCFVKACTLSFAKMDVALSDNGFDIVPGIENTVICQASQKIGIKEFASRIKVKSVGTLMTGKA